jgi:hypothetical protein
MMRILVAKVARCSPSHKHSNRLALRPVDFDFSV